jgi:hypothetical protein
METRKAQEQQKSRVSIPARRIRSIDHEHLENYLENVDRCRTCIEGMAAVVDMLDTGRLHHESEKLIEDQQGNIATGLAVLLAVCATEMRIDMEVFRRDGFADNEGGIQ